MTGFSPHNAMAAMMQALGQVGQPGVPLDFSDPSTFTNNPAMSAALWNMGVMGGMGASALSPLMAGMMGQPSGFSITHINVQPGKTSRTQQQKNDALIGRRQQNKINLDANAMTRGAQRNQQQLPAQAYPVADGSTLA